jgi:type IV secretion system protein VirB10
MLNAVNNNLAGDLVAIVSKDIFSSDGKRLLIPRYSKLKGQYEAGRSQGEARLFAIWNRLEIQHDLFIDIGAPISDNLGRSGLAGNVNRHFVKRFGAAILLSVLPVAIDAAIGEETDERLRDATSSSLENAATIALQSSINLPPTISVPQGRCFNVVVNKDLDFGSIL